LRKPQRVTITISWQTYQQLLDRSDNEGRSLSNLAAHLLERGVCG
jgi:predicted CopG family antitoxin